MKRALGAVGTLLVSAAVAWAGGFDFDYRSGGVATWVVLSLAVASLVSAHPGWDRK